MVRHYLGIDDFTKSEYMDLFRRAEAFRAGGDFTDLCSGKVLGLLFLEESTRTLTSMQSAIIRLGGGWTGITSKTGKDFAGSEFATKELVKVAKKRALQVRKEQHDVETLDEVLSTMASMSDIFAIRSNANLEATVRDLKIPVIGCGFMGRHAIGGLWAPYSLWHLMGGKFGKINVGIYGAPAFSRVSISVVETLSRLADVTVYQDSVMPDGTITKSAIKGGNVKMVEGKMEDFLEELDLLVVSEGVFSYKDVAYNLKFANKLRPLTPKLLERAKDKLLITCSEPGLMLNGRDNVDMGIRYNNDKYHASSYYLREGVFVNMAMMTFLLGVKI
ncbi:MAG: hypothetical protein KGH77_04415 [Candidatus Micrarchaeota archaeon]|nr:hypothetical protein [Candidatus Micrarchaeota archaeon]MDE1864638.1 hypothetical protein [Candidatus Micrarchaeota archaeon]